MSVARSPPASHAMTLQQQTDRCRATRERPRAADILCHNSRACRKILVTFWLSSHRLGLVTPAAFTKEGNLEYPARSYGDRGR